MAEEFYFNSFQDHYCTVKEVDAVRNWTLKADYIYHTRNKLKKGLTKILSSKITDINSTVVWDVTILSRISTLSILYKWCNIPYHFWKDSHFLIQFSYLPDIIVVSFNFLMFSFSLWTSATTFDMFSCFWIYHHIDFHQGNGHSKSENRLVSEILGKYFC